MRISVTDGQLLRLEQLATDYISGFRGPSAAVVGKMALEAGIAQMEAANVDIPERVRQAVNGCHSWLLTYASDGEGLPLGYRLSISDATEIEYALWLAALSVTRPREAIEADVYMLLQRQSSGLLDSDDLANASKRAVDILLGGD